MQVHRAGVDRRRRLTRSGGTEDATGAGLQDRDLSARRAPDVHGGMGIDAGSGEVAGGPPTQEAVVDEGGGDLLGVPGANLGVGEGSSVAAHSSCGPRTYGFDGSITTRSIGLSSNASGW